MDTTSRYNAGTNWAQKQVESRTGAVALVFRWLMTRLSPALPQSGLAWLCFLLPGRPGELHPEPPTDPDVVGIDPRRAHHAMNDMVTFPRASLQSRKVGFPDSGFRPGFPQEAFPR